jgi:hypothetical protein
MDKEGFTMKNTIHIIAWIFLILSVLALAIFLIGYFGLFGTERTPFAAVFLAILGQPWVQLVGYFPQSLLPWASAATPFINSAILFWIASRVAR